MTEKPSYPSNAHRAGMRPARDYWLLLEPGALSFPLHLTSPPFSGLPEGPPSRPRSAWADTVSALSPVGKPKKVQEFLVLVERSARESFPVSEAARQVGLSVRQLTRLVVASLGYPPGMIIDLARVFSVAREILSGRTTLKSTAMEHNFPDQTSMTRLFARFTGVTPGEYRRKAEAPVMSETAQRMSETA